MRFSFNSWIQHHTLSSDSGRRDVSCTCPAPQCLPSTCSQDLHPLPLRSSSYIGLDQFPELSNSRQSSDPPPAHTQPQWWDNYRALHAVIQISPATYFLFFQQSLMLFSSFHPRRSSWHRIRLTVRLLHFTLLLCGNRNSARHKRCSEVLLPVSGIKTDDWFISLVFFGSTGINRLNRFYEIISLSQTNPARSSSVGV